MFTRPESFLPTFRLDTRSRALFHVVSLFVVVVVVFVVTVVEMVVIVVILVVVVVIIVMSLCLVRLRELIFRKRNSH